MNNVIDRLTQVINERRQSDPDCSYVSGLYHAGLDHILKKVGEESTEMIIAAKSAEHDRNLQAVIHETADLCFHTMVMLSHLGLEFNDVLNELESRFGLSGIEEKQARK